MRVFVYGTLKKGQSNNYLLEGAEFLGEYRTPPKYSLYSLGQYPAMSVKDLGVAVLGEVYQVDTKTLGLLDLLEGVPDLYKRITMSCGKYGKCHVYVMDNIPARARVLIRGVWE